jgi:hypothetical protein
MRHLGKKNLLILVAHCKYSDPNQSVIVYLSCLGVHLDDPLSIILYLLSGQRPASNHNLYTLGIVLLHRAVITFELFGSHDLQFESMKCSSNENRFVFNALKTLGVLNQDWQG